MNMMTTGASPDLVQQLRKGYLNGTRVHGHLAIVEVIEQLRAELRKVCDLAVRTTGLQDHANGLLEAEVKELITERDALLLDARPFPMLDNGPPITWGIAKVIYAGYAAMGGVAQSLERVAERGGFGWGEVSNMQNDRRFKAAVRKALHSGDESA